MNNLSNEMLEKTTGGEITIGGVSAIVGAIIFVIGVIDGLFRLK